ncbi:MAG: RDD family protein [Steroidobacter sp.]
MSSAISKTVAAKNPVLWCLGLYVLLFCGVLISGHVSAAAAVSVHADQHSLSVAINADDKAAVAQSSASSQDDDAGNADHDENMHAANNNSGSSERDNVQVFGDAHLQAGEHARDLVSVMGSSTNEGSVAHDVVSVLGMTRVTGTVGHDAVAVLGNNYINNKVDHDVVAVMGDVELGPQAEIGHDVVAVGGMVKRDPSAVVHGGVQSVGPHFGMGGFDWLHSWLQNCLFKGRLLAFDSGVIWAWWVALIALAVYALTALLFPRAVDQCVSVMEQKPGHVVLAGLLATVGLPIVIVLLCITIIGIIAIPFIGVTLMIAGFFGKVVMLAWIGRRLLRTQGNEALSQPAVAVVIGGVIMMLLYTIPILSFLLYKVLGFLGIGVAVYALLLEIKSRRGDGDGGGKGATGTSGSSADLADKGHHADAAQSSTADLSSAPHDATALNELPRAGFWVRMVALMIDAFLIGIVTSMVIHPKWFGVDTDHVIVTLLAIYGAVMWKLRGATVGDIVFKLQVVRADGRPIDWPTAIIRSLGCFLSIMVIGLGFFWIAFDEHKQGWHDKIAGTLVVHNPKGISLV